MKVQGVWWGGPSYSYGDMTEDMEEFLSLSHARDVLRERYDSDGRFTCPTFYIDRNNEPVYFPCVTREGHIDIISGGDIVRRISFGPRGGVRVENG